ncbi:MAG: hypothetical protein KC501_32455 [Myxococcales bacterium]|nr:hypothetical protein [Myxococcales bacterium]
MPSFGSRTRAATIASFLALSLAGPSLAGAEEVMGTRSEELVERSHEIRLTLEHGVASLRVRRTVHNGGPRHDQAMFWIDVPPAAVATGLRTKGTLGGRPHWFEGDLLEAEAAAERYRELTGIGGYYPKDPALLSWRGQEQLALQVFPVAPSQDKTVEYTFSLPTTYEQGRDHLVLPPMGTDAHPARVTLHPGHPRDQLFVDGEPVPRGAMITLDAEHTVALSRHDPARIEATLASVPFGTDRVLMHYDVALAPSLSTIPRDARVVVVIDGSRSLAPEDRQAAAATASAYLRHFAGPRSQARAEVLVFDHELHARHGGLVPVREALADLEHLELPEANGSRLDDALAEAGRLLAAGPAGPRRILVLTDARTRESLDPARLQALGLGSDAIVHVGIVEAGWPRLERDDDHPWAGVATATGGLVWQLANAPGEAEAEAVFEELARPLRLDHLRVMAPPFEDPDVDLMPTSLDEGQGLELLQVVEAPIRHLRVEGQLWSEPVHETVLPDDAQGRRWAALVFGSDLLSDLSEEEMMPLALHGGAVSPVTSYLAIEPGVRPSTEGLYEGEGGIGIGMLGFAGGGSGIGLAGTGSGRATGPDTRQQTLERVVRAALDACGGEGLGIHLELETTSEEIVELGPLEVRGSGDPILVPCVERGVWAQLLGPEFDDAQRRWTIDLPG